MHYIKGNRLLLGEVDGILEILDLATMKITLRT